MATVVALDASPENVLRSLRGSIIDARIAELTASTPEATDTATVRM